MRKLFSLLLLSGCCSTAAAQDIVITDRPAVVAVPVVAKVVTPVPRVEVIKPKPVAKPVAKSSGPLRMSWNIQGDWSPTEAQTRAHLQSEHGVDTTGMSHQQMLTLHDAIHNGTTSSFQKAQTVYRSSSSCPGGICPVNQSTQYRRSGRRSRR